MEHKHLNIKRAFCFLAIIISCFTVYAQSHIQFMGIPLNGDFDSFKEKLAERDIHKDSYNKSGFSGFFFGVIAGIEVSSNKKTGSVYKAIVRYNESMTGMNQSQIVSLYKRICQGLRNKYPKAKIQSVDGDLFLSLSTGYIRCNLFGVPKIFGAATIELTYEDKANSPKFEVPELKDRDKDL